MKLIFTYACVCCCLMFTQYVTAQTTYQIDIKGGKSNYLISSQPMKNGDCLVSSYDYFSPTKTVLKFVRINSLGKVVWSKYFFVPGYNSYSACLASTTDNGFISVARLDSGGRYGEALEIFKCDSNGNIEWQKKIVPDSKSGIYLDKIIQRKDGGYYLVYDENKFTALSKFDVNGNVIWIKGFDATVTDYGYNIRDLREADDGGALIAISDISCEFYCINFKIYKFSSTGNPEADLIFNPDFSFSSDVSYMNQDSTGKFKILFKGWILRAPAGNYSYITIQPDSNIGNALTFSDDIFSLQYLLRTNKIPGSRKLFTSRNGFLENNKYFNKDLSINTSIQYYAENNTEYTSVEKYDSLGRICPNFSAPSIDSTVNKTQIALFQGIFSLKTNTDFSFQNSNLLSSDIDTDTLLCEGVSPEFSGKLANNSHNTIWQNNSVSIYPNPAQDFLIISVPDKINSLAFFQIISIDGNIKRKYSAKANEQLTQKINISDLPKGIYFLKAEVNNKELIFKFFKD